MVVETRLCFSGCIWTTGMCSPDLLVAHSSGRDAAGFDQDTRARARSLARSIDRHDTTRPVPSRHGPELCTFLFLAFPSPFYLLLLPLSMDLLWLLTDLLWFLAAADVPEVFFLFPVLSQGD